MALKCNRKGIGWNNVIQNFIWLSFYVDILYSLFITSIQQKNILHAELNNFKCTRTIQYKDTHQMPLRHIRGMREALKIQNILPQDTVLVKSFEIFFDWEILWKRNATKNFLVRFCFAESMLWDKVVYLLLVDVEKTRKLLKFCHIYSKKTCVVVLISL